MKKRVDILHRVSTKQQINKDENDIPLQKNACRDFAEKMGWEIVNEYSELGVSGYKVSEANRDKIQDIRRDAEQGKIDIVLVFMCDRLGRRASETPFVVEWFVSKGVEVWSVKEGQQRIETHVDKLTNYIRYWQAEGESEKTSTRIVECQGQMTNAGQWCGGTVPYGYKLVPNGKVGKKNKLLNDLVKDEITGRIVDMIFDYVIHKGYGTLRLANYLNERFPNPEKVWHPQSIRTIIRNPMYTGRFRRSGKLSPVNEAWRYISDADAELAQRAIESRIARRYPQSRATENALVPEGKTKASVYGATLLSGILYCGHCGHKLVGGYSTHHNKYEISRLPIYRCYNNSNKAKGCTGKAVYTARFIEDAVMKAISGYFEHFQGDVMAIWNTQVKAQLKRKHDRRLRDAETSLESLKVQYAKLKDEVMKSLLGESAFDATMIQTMLDEKASQINEAQKQVDELRTEQAAFDESVKHLSEQFQNIQSWRETFYEANNDEKKMILARMIERIEVNRDYEITIRFFIALEDFKEAIENSREDGYNIVIEEVDSSMAM